MIHTRRGAARVDAALRSLQRAATLRLLRSAARAAARLAVLQRGVRRSLFVRRITGTISDALHCMIRYVVHHVVQRLLAHTSQGSARRQLFERDRGVCQQCDFDAHSLFLRVAALQSPQATHAHTAAYCCMYAAVICMPRHLRKIHLYAHAPCVHTSARTSTPLYAGAHAGAA